MTTRQHLICGIDIGNYAIKTVIAEADRDSLAAKIIGVGRVSSHGLRRGVVTDMGELVSNIRQSVDRAETMAGAKITRAYVSINGLHINSQLSKGVIIVSRADNEISQHDIDRVIEAASTINLPQNREIIHRLPRSFTIDAQEQVKNALGMKGVRLEAEVLLIAGLSAYLNNIAKCVHENNIEVAEFVFAPLASSKSVLDKHQREHGVLSIDFGGGSSALSLFHESELIHSAILPIGSRHITNDLAVAFRTSMENAEIIKCSYGYIGLDEETRKDVVDLSSLVGEDNFIVPRKQINRIVEARVSEVFDMINGELKKIPYSYILPAGLVLSGAGSNLKGLLPFAKNRLKLSTHIVNEYPLDGLEEHVKDPGFAVAVGLVLWGLEREGTHASGIFSRFNNSVGGDGLKKISKWLKNFMP